jgi:hypothetical protein
MAFGTTPGVRADEAALVPSQRRSRSPDDSRRLCQIESIPGTELIFTVRISIVRFFAQAPRKRYIRRPARVQLLDGVSSSSCQEAKTSTLGGEKRIDRCRTLMERNEVSGVSLRYGQHLRCHSTRDATPAGKHVSLDPVQG